MIGMRSVNDGTRSLGLLACLLAFFLSMRLSLSLSLSIVICVAVLICYAANGGCFDGSAASNRGSKVGCGRDWKQVECLLGYLNEGRPRKDR